MFWRKIFNSWYTSRRCCLALTESATAYTYRQYDEATAFLQLSDYQIQQQRRRLFAWFQNLSDIYNCDRRNNIYSYVESPELKSQSWWATEGDRYRRRKKSRQIYQQAEADNKAQTAKSTQSLKTTKRPKLSMKQN